MFRLTLALIALAALGCEYAASPLLPAAAVAAAGTENSGSGDNNNPTQDDTSKNDNSKQTEKSGKKQAKEKSVKNSSDNNPTQFNKLNEFESWVILQKGTERAFTGEYTDLKDPGTYICRRCNAPLYHAKHKFSSHCGWPSFDDEIEGAVRQSRDADGFRVEITCKNCGGHLGHVFFGEGFTEKNTRHCVNSVSMKFIPEGSDLPPVVRKKTSKSSRSSSKTQKSEPEPGEKQNSDPPTTESPQ